MNELEFAVKYCRAESFCKFPDVIPLDFGLDFHLESRPDLYTEVYVSPGASKRSVRLVISSFRDISFDAMHYYGKLEADGVNIIEEKLDSDGKLHKYCCGGYICEEYAKMKNRRHYEGFYDFELLRDITQEEIDKDPDRWRGYKAGVTETNAFNTKSEIIELAKRVVKIRFPEWEFIIEDD